MSHYDSIVEIREELKKCMKCGNCQAVCPLYKETIHEVTVARGKISLVEAVVDGLIPITEGFKERMDLCLMCKACVANCPNGVKVDEIMLAARAAAVRAKGLPFPKKVAFSALKKPFLFNLGIKTGRHFQGMVMKKYPDKNGAYMRFPVGINMRRIVPSLASKSLREELPEINSVTRPKMRVAFFTGCTINYCYTSIGKAVVNVLNKNGIEVIIPAKQHCCGTPIYTSGDINTARKIAKYNIDILYNILYGLKVNAIITSCATCGVALKNDYVKLLIDDKQGYEGKAHEISEKVYDIAQFLVDVINFKEVEMSPVNSRVTYHDPCHLNRGMGVNKQPREILKSIPGVEFVEMKDAGCCCGGAGSFSLMHYDLSMAVHRNKIENIRATHTDTVVTGCPSCRMQLEEGINRFILPNEVLHTVEILNMAYK